MTADPQRPVSSVDLLDDAERIRLGEFGQPGSAGAAGPAKCCRCRLVAAPGVAYPGCGGCHRRGLVADVRASWMRSSQRLAQVLAGRGVGPGRCVAWCCRARPDAVVAMVAVLKSGAAYLPVDPGLPAERLEFVLADAAPTLAITTAEFADGWTVLTARSSMSPIRTTSPNPQRTSRCRCRDPATWRM